MSEPTSIAEIFLGRWADDPVGGMSMTSPDITYTLNVDPGALQLGGETKGWPAVNAMMLNIREVFDYLVYRPRLLGFDGDTARFRIEIMYRHRPSGEILSGNMRCVVTVKNEQVTRVDEFVDAPMIETFMRLFGSGVAAQS